jgi:hypothetical protein
MSFINNTVSLLAGGPQVDLYVCPADLKVTLSTINAFAPVSTGRLSLWVFRQASGQTVPLLAGLSVALNAPYTHPKPIMLSAGDKLVGSAVDAGLSVDLGGVVSGASAGTATLVARGPFDPQATYQKLHIAEANGSSYLCLQDGLTGVAPPSAPWMILAEKGDEGSVEGHSHAIADVTGLQGALDAKASSGHSHGIEDVTGLSGVLDGKATSLQGAKADAAMPKSGGTFSGQVILKGVTETRHQIFTFNAEIDFSRATRFYINTSGNTAFTVANGSAGRSALIRVKANGDHALDWSGIPNLQFPGGQAPSAPASGQTNVYVLECEDGTNYTLSLVQEGVA